MPSYLVARPTRDAAYLGFACSYAIDYLLTWNCAHIANAEVRRQLSRLNGDWALRRR